MRAMMSAAIAVFDEDGYAGVSTRRVAERAGCSETLVFRYFGSKQGLLLAIVNLLGEMIPTIETDLTASQSLESLIDVYLRSTFRNMREHPAIYRLVAAALVTDPSLTAEFEQRHESNIIAITQQLARFQRSGEIARDVDIVPIAVGLQQMGFAVGLFLHAMYGRPASETDAIARSFSIALSRGLHDSRPSLLVETERQAAVNAASAARESLDIVLSMLDDAAVASEDAMPLSGQ